MMVQEVLDIFLFSLGIALGFRLSICLAPLPLNIGVNSKLRVLISNMMCLFSSFSLLVFSFWVS